MKRKIRIAVDILMTFVLVLLMAYSLVGEAYHEWLGMGMFVLFIAHHVLNRKWITYLNKGKYTPFRIAQTILVIAIFISMIGSMVSGILVSRYIFVSVKISGTAVYAERIHMLCAYWGFVLMSLHLGIHWSVMTGMSAKRWETLPAVVRGILRIAGAGVMCYGVYAFWKRTIGDYLFLKSHFVFFDFGESLVLFLLDYLAVMGAFVFFGHYIGKGLKGFKRKKKEGKE